MRTHEVLYSPVKEPSPGTRSRSGRENGELTVILIRGIRVFFRSRCAHPNLVPLYWLKPHPQQAECSPIHRALKAQMKILNPNR